MSRQPATFAVKSAQELAVVTRSGFIESRHIGSAVLLGKDGQIVEAIGDVRAPIFPRSTLKTVQAAVCLDLGATLRGKQAAIATASHAGTAEHTQIVTSILQSAQLEPADLQCPPALPGSAKQLAELNRLGAGPAPIWMNCSGKHAAMLAACKAQGWERASYLAPDHPLQMQIRAAIETIGQEQIAHTGVDGCGAPVYAVSLVALARMTQWAVSAHLDAPDSLERSAAQVVAAVHETPWVIHGPGEHNTIVIEELGIFAKGGAEGVLVLGVPSGESVAVKILDGSSRAVTAVGLALLARHGLIDADAARQLSSQLGLHISGGTSVVGEIEVLLN